MTAEQIDLIERIAARAPELASDVRILIDEVNRLRDELSRIEAIDKVSQMQSEQFAIVTRVHWTGDRERAVKD